MTCPIVGHEPRLVRAVPPAREDPGHRLDMTCPGVFRRLSLAVIVFRHSTDLGRTWEPGLMEAGPAAPSGVGSLRVRTSLAVGPGQGVREFKVRCLLVGVSASSPSAMERRVSVTEQASGGPTNAPPTLQWSAA